MNHLRNVKFLVDFMCGRLCKWLRICGFDAEYFRSQDRGELLLKSLKEKRIIISRNLKLSRIKPWGLVQLKSEKLDEQLSQLANELNLKIDEEKLFTRCTVCNSEIQTVNKEEIKGKVPPFVYQTHDEFSICPICNRIYWEGTHWERMREKLKELFK